MSWPPPLPRQTVLLRPVAHIVCLRSWSRTPSSPIRRVRRLNVKVTVDGTRGEPSGWPKTRESSVNGITNSIAWLIWHLSRWRDKISAAIAGETEVWTGQDWHRKFGLAADRTGLGDSLEQVAAFRVERELLQGYAEAAHQALVSRIANCSLAQLEAEIEYQPGSSRPAWRALVSVVEDSAEHTGQVNYLRGMMAGHGWR